MEVAAAVEVATGARVDWATFAAIRRRCARTLEEFGAMERLLAIWPATVKEERRQGRCGGSGCESEV